MGARAYASGWVSLFLASEITDSHLPVLSNVYQYTASPNIPTCSARNSTREQNRAKLSQSVGVSECRSVVPARGRAPRAITRSIWPTSPTPLLFSHRPGPAARFSSLVRPRPALRLRICDRPRGGGARAGRDILWCCRPPVPLATSRPLLDPDGSRQARDVFSVGGGVALRRTLCSWACMSSHICRALLRLGNCSTSKVGYRSERIPGPSRRWAFRVRPAIYLFAGRPTPEEAV